VEANKDNFVEAARELVRDAKSASVLCGLDRTHRERGDREAHLPTMDGDAYDISNFAFEIPEVSQPQKLTETNGN